MDSRHRPSISRRHFADGLLAGGLATVLAACGGGIYLTYDYFPDNTPPSVSLAVSPQSAMRGQAVSLAAAATDDQGVDRVIFFRLEPGGGATQLAIRCCPPYDWTTTVPANAQTSVGYFARAVDVAGNVADSAAVFVTVTQ